LQHSNGWGKHPCVKALATMPHACTSFHVLDIAACVSSRSCI